MPQHPPSLSGNPALGIAQPSRRDALALAGAAVAATLVRPAWAQPAGSGAPAPTRGFVPVPDWFSAENQGAGIAVLDPPGGGAPHLVVFMVDAGPQQNRGLFRIGRTLDAEGRVTGGWTQWIDVPDWFSWENQGAGIAVADLGGGGRDLVVFMVDNGPQQNRGLFRIGRGLDANGNIAGGWTPWVEVPDWFPWENQGAGIAVTPPGAQGRRDLVVFMIDNGPELNRGLYRLGQGLGANGTITGGWTPWMDVPDWLAWENQGGGVAVMPGTGGGAPSLVVFQIDNAPVTANGGQNQAFFRLGTGLGANGAVANWSQSWLGVPHWFSWENQHGAIATAKLGGRDRLLVLMVDNPGGQNAGLYQLVDLEPDPALHGKWEVLPFLSGVLGVHAALLPGGEVLFFAGSGSSQNRFDSPDFGDVAKGSAVSVVWSPPGNSFFHPPTLRTADQKVYDLFCGGDAFLPDGRMVSVGGTIDYPFKGRKEAAAFDPATRSWAFLAPMAHERWYPSVIVLGDGRLLAASGLEPAQKKVLEIYSAANNAWQQVDLAGNLAGLPLYAHLFQLADGRVFFTGGRMDDPLMPPPAILNIAQNPVSAQVVGGLRDLALRNQSNSVLLAPAQDQRILVCGGGPFDREDPTYATDKADIVDLRGANPAYAAAAPMALPRMHHNTVLLPDRTVFASGGALQQEALEHARLQAELYDPASNSWRVMAAATVPRLYHSTAVLLPDGRVVTAGGNPNGGHSVMWMPPDPEEEMRLEVYSPPYLFRGPRPVIGNAPERCAHGETIAIASPQAANIRFVSLMRSCVTTHAFDGGQRLVDLPIQNRDGGALRATVPGNADLAPAGWYMLFLVDQQGVPSVARWIRVG